MVGQIFFDEVQASFNLRQPKREKPTNIYLVVRINNKQVKLATGVKVYPEHWNVKKQMAYVSVRLTELDNINNTITNDKLAEFRASFLEYKRYLCEHPDELINNLELLRKYIYKNKAMTNSGIIKPLSWFKEHITKKSAKTARSEMDNFKTFCQFLIDNDIELNDFSQINYELLIKYETYLKDKSKKLTKATLINKISLILILVNAAADEDLLDKGKQGLNKYKKPKSKLDDNGKVIIEDAEIDAIYKAEVDTIRQEQVRDLFVLACLIGQRISDIKGMKCRINNGITEIWSKKTSTYTPISLYDDRILEIFKKYNDELPEFTTGVFNSLIKKIAKTAGLTYEVEIPKEMAWDEIIREVKPKCDVISSHAGRRTLTTTLMGCEGLNEQDIIAVTGHRDTRMLAQYDRRSKQQKVVKAGKALANMKLKGESSVEKATAPTLSKAKKKLKVLDYLLAEDTLLRLQKLQDNGINIYDLPEIKKVMDTIKDVKRIDEVRLFLDGIDKKLLYTRVNMLEPIIYKMARHNCDFTLYQLFQQKVVELGLSDKINRIIDHDLLDEFWAMDYADKDLESLKGVEDKL